MGLEVTSTSHPNPELGLRYQGSSSEDGKSQQSTAKEETDDEDDGDHGLHIKGDVYTTNVKSTLKSHTLNKVSLPDQVMNSFSSTYKDSLRETLEKSEFNFVLTDPRVQDNPIVYASDGFLKMTGYTAEEALGRNCRFLQGPATDRRTIMQIRDAIREERACQVSILNYTKQGKPFWNLFHLSPIYSREDGRVVHFLGVQTPLNSVSTESQLLQGIQCFCFDEAEPGSCADQPVRVEFPKSSAPDEIDEENCEVQQTDREKAKSSVKSLMVEITSKCKGVGISDSRCSTELPGTGVQQVSSSLMLSLTKVQQSFVLANPYLPDMPIVHASDVFLKMTGYSREEVVGRNCRFLQGPNTDPEAVQLIREALQAETSCTVRLLNYRKDKVPFWNLLHIAPVRSSLGKVAFYVGVQLEVSSITEERSEVTPDIKQLGAVGAVRVAVRSLQGEGLRRIRKSEQ